MTEFDQVIADMDDALLGIMGEEFVFRPMTRLSPNAATGSVDPLRVEGVVFGVFSTEADEMDMGGGNSYDPRADRRMRHYGATKTVAVRQADVPSEIRAGDRLTRVSTDKTYSIGEVRRDGSGILTLVLNGVG